MDGYISLEVNPVLSNSTAQTITEAIELFKILQRPNIMIKVPATDAGIPAIRELIKEGVNINVTLIFSLSMYRKVMNSYIAGLEDRLLLGKDIDKISSVASFFVSRIDTKVDPLIYEATNSNDKPPTGLLGFTAIANASLAYHEFQNTFKKSCSKYAMDIPCRNEISVRLVGSLMSVSYTHLTLPTSALV